MVQPLKAVWQGRLSLDRLPCEFPWGLLPAPALIVVEGPMGAGKTAWVRAFLGRKGVTTYSPTFQIQIPITDNIQHWDLYRVESESHLEAVGFWPVVENLQMTVIVEWAHLWHIPWRVNRSVWWVTVLPYDETSRLYVLGFRQ